MTPNRTLLLALVTAIAAAATALLLGAGSAGAALAYLAFGITALLFADQRPARQRIVAAQRGVSRHG